MNDAYPIIWCLLLIPALGMILFVVSWLADYFNQKKK